MVEPVGRMVQVAEELEVQVVQAHFVLEKYTFKNKKRFLVYNNIYNRL
jgi:hypothetical protein